MRFNTNPYKSPTEVKFEYDKNGTITKLDSPKMNPVFNKPIKLKK